MKKINFTLPMLAALLGFAVLIGTSAFKSHNSALTSNWIYDTTSADSLNQDSYTQVGDITAQCMQVANLCGIIAPIDPASDPNNPKPDLSDPDLQQRIKDRDTGSGDVFLLPAP